MALSGLRYDWRQRIVELGYDPEWLLHRVMGRRLETASLDHAAVDRMAETALASVGDRQSSWRPAELVRELAAKGLGVLMISSELEEIVSLADRVAVLSDGRTVKALQGSQIGEDAIMAAMAGSEHFEARANG